MGTKTTHRMAMHPRVNQQSTGDNGWRALIISLSPDKIRALGTLFLCIAIALQILAMPLYQAQESSSIRHWGEITIVGCLCSAISGRRTKLKV